MVHFLDLCKRKVDIFKMEFLTMPKRNAPKTSLGIVHSPLALTEVHRHRSSCYRLVGVLIPPFSLHTKHISNFLQNRLKSQPLTR